MPIMQQWSKADKIADYYSVKLRNVEAVKAYRWSTYRYWLRSFRDVCHKELNELSKQMDGAAENLDFSRLKQNSEICQTKKVIGMTTTAAAKNSALIRDLGCKIVIAEEAAEVQESHIVSVLPASCQHLILIGDHQQLRPKSTSYALEVKYNLDISLFERLIKNNVVSNRLSEQHRMRPTISHQMQHCFYKGLENHHSVMSRPDIPGVVKNVQFINYGGQNLFEQEDRESVSKVNEHEAKFVVMLAEYFVKNGHDPNKITILTFYLGQLFEIRSLFREMKIEISCQTVDNFQGQENDIIILSLVRSNKQKRGGFSTIQNRVCVALSRNC